MLILLSVLTVVHSFTTLVEEEQKRALLATALASDDLAAAFAVARGGATSSSLRSRRLDSPPSFVEWVSARVGLSRLVSAPLFPGRLASAPPPRPTTTVHVTLPDGRTLPVHARSAATLAPALSGTPLRGFIYEGTLYAEEEAHACEAAGEQVLCSIAGGPLQAFVDEAAAAAAVLAERQAAGNRYRASLGLPPLEASHDQGRQLQLGAAPGTTFSYGGNFEDPATGRPKKDGSGVRRMLVVSTTWTGMPALPADKHLKNEQLQRAANGTFALLAARSFGALAFNLTFPGCTYLSPLTFDKAATGSLTHAEVRDALFPPSNPVINPAGGKGSDCAAFNANDFDNVVINSVYVGKMGTVSGAMAGGGTALAPGKWTWLTGGENFWSGDPMLTKCFAHEVGHNLGLMHASGWEDSNEWSGFNQYGDFWDVMGWEFSLELGNFQAASGVALGWIPPVRVAHVDALGAGPATGAATSAVVRLAAIDRNNKPGDAAAVWASYPQDVVLTVRVVVPMTARMRLINPSCAGENMFLYLTYRTARALTDGLAGVTLNEFCVSSSGSILPVLVKLNGYGGGSKRVGEQKTLIKHNDAYVYGGNATRILVEVGEPMRIFPGPNPYGGYDSADFALPVRVTPLGTDGTPLDGASPPGCYAPSCTSPAAIRLPLQTPVAATTEKVKGDAAGLAYTQVNPGTNAALPSTPRPSPQVVSPGTSNIPALPQGTPVTPSTQATVSAPDGAVRVTASGTAQLSLSASASVAVFQLTSQAATVVTATTCGATAPAAALVLSAVIGPRPSALIGGLEGTVGVDGDVAGPGAGSAALCATISFPLSAGTAGVWLLAGAPGYNRQTALSGTLTITYGGTLSPVASAPAKLAGCDWFDGLTWQPTTLAAGDNRLDAGMMAAGLGGLAAGKAAYISPDAYYMLLWNTPTSTYTVLPNCQKAEWGCDWYYCRAVTITAPCPAGSFSSNGVCTACPLGAQTSPTGSTAASACKCPAGWTAGNTACSPPPTSSYVLSLSSTTPAALFSVTSPTRRMATATTCTVTASGVSLPYPAVLGLSAVYGSQPVDLSIAGSSGDVAAPGAAPGAAAWSTCVTITFPVSSTPVWLVVGSPGTAFGTALTGQLTISFPAASEAPSTIYGASMAISSGCGDFWGSQTFLPVAVTRALADKGVGKPGWIAQGMYVLLQDGSSYAIYLQKSQGGWLYCNNAVTLQAPCPAGTYGPFGGPCTACPLDAQTSPTGSTAASACRCPSGWVAGATACVLGATPVATFPSRFTIPFNSRAPAAVFSVTSPTATIATATTCNSAGKATYTVPVLLSVVLGGAFPSDLVEGSGNIGLSGDIVSGPGTAAAQCGSVSFPIAAGGAVYLVAGSPNPAKGSTITATLTVSFNSPAITPSATTLPTMTLSTPNACSWEPSAGAFKALAWTPTVITPSDPRVESYYRDKGVGVGMPAWTATHPRGIFLVVWDPTLSPPAYGVWSSLETLSWSARHCGPVVPVALCPPATYLASGTCTPCELRGQITPPGATSAAACTCPPKYTISGGSCVAPAPPAMSVYAPIISSSQPVALYAISGASSPTFVKATTCAPGVSYPAPLVLSTSVGVFPLQMLTGAASVGVAGDNAVPGAAGFVDAATTPCYSLTFPLTPGSTVWLAVGSPGAARGTPMTGRLTIIFGADAARAAMPLPASAGFTAVAGTWPGGGCPQLESRWSPAGLANGGLKFTAGKYALLPQQAGSSVYGISDSNSGGWYCTGITLSGACPTGSYPDGATGCTACPFANATSAPFAKSASDCTCPVGWTQATPSSACTGIVGTEATITVTRPTVASAALTPASPAALFTITSPVDTTVVVSTCPRSGSNAVPIGLSSFLGAYPPLSLLSGGGVGKALGHNNVPGVVDPSVIAGATCFNLSLPASAGVKVYVAVGAVSASDAATTTLTATVTFYFGSAMQPAPFTTLMGLGALLGYSNGLSPEMASDCAAGTFQPIAPVNGFPAWAFDWRYIVYNGEFYDMLSGSPTGTSGGWVRPGLMVPLQKCPPGSWGPGYGACNPCPWGQTSPMGSTSAAACQCPSSMYIPAVGGPCTGPTSLLLPPTAAQPVCSSAACSSLPTVQTIAGTATYAFSQSPATPVAVFAVTSPGSDSNVTASTCFPGASYTAPAGFSIFMGGFPASHAYYGGSVGESGDTAVPGTADLAVLGTTLCYSATFPVKAGSTVWLVGGSPGLLRGTLQTGQLSFTYASPSVPALTTGPAKGRCPQVPVKNNPASNCASNAAFFLSQWFQPRAQLEGQNAWVLQDFNYANLLAYSSRANGFAGGYIWASFISSGWGTQTKGLVGDWNGRPFNPAVRNGTSLPVEWTWWGENMALHGQCPSGTFSAAPAVCAACPLPNQISFEDAASPADCRCPYGWAVVGGKCTGPHVGGPAATALLPPAAGACPSGAGLYNGACVLCASASGPLATSCAATFPAPRPPTTPAASGVCPSGTAVSAASASVCTPCGPGFAGTGTACVLCPLHAAAAPGAAVCTCPPGYSTASGACAPPPFLDLSSAALSGTLTLSRLQYVPVPTPPAATLLDTSGAAFTAAFVWRASPVYAFQTIPAGGFGSLYWAWGGPWGAAASTALNPAALGGASATAGSNWALDAQPALYIQDPARTTPALASGRLALPLPTTQVPFGQAATYGFLPGASDAAPLSSAQPFFMYSNATAVRAFTPTAGTLAPPLRSPTQRTLAAAGVNVTGAQLGSLPVGARVSFSLYGLVGSGDKLALVATGTPCASLTADTSSTPATVSTNLTATLIAPALLAANQSGWALCSATNPALTKGVATYSAVLDSAGAVFQVPLLCSACPTASAPTKGARVLSAFQEPEGEHRRSLATASPGVGLAALYAGCAPCAAAGKTVGGLKVGDPQSITDKEGSATGLRVSWTGSSSGLITGRLLAVTGAHTSAVLDLYISDPITGVRNTSFTAGSANFTLDRAWLADLAIATAAMPATPDSLLLALSYFNVTAYSAPFSLSNGLPQLPTVVVTRPSYALDGSEASTEYIAGVSNLTVQWNSVGAPWTQAWDILLMGVTYFGDDCTLTAATNLTPTATGARFNTNGDGTGASHTYTLTVPAAASGAYLSAVVRPSGHPDDSLDSFSESELYFMDMDARPLKLALLTPTYNSLFNIGGNFTFTWSHSGPWQDDDILWLDLVNSDTGEDFTWRTDCSVTQATNCTVRLLGNLASDGSWNDDAVDVFSKRGFTELNNDDFTSPVEVLNVMSAGQNYQAYITVLRETFSVFAQSSFLRILPPGAPVVALNLSFPGSGRAGAFMSLGQSATLAWNVSNASPLNSSNFTVQLWLSQLGYHEPNADLPVATLSSGNAVFSDPRTPGLGGANVTLPRDPTIAPGASYFVTVTCDQMPYVAAASPYFAIAPPTLNFTAPTAATVATCGASLTLAWSSMGLSDPVKLQLRRLDRATLKDTFLADIATVDPFYASPLTLSLPAAMPSAQYSVYALPTYDASAPRLAATPYFFVNCAKRITVDAVAPFTAGDAVTVTFSTTGLPSGAALTVLLVTSSSGVISTTLSTTATNTGFFLWPQWPTWLTTDVTGLSVRVRDTLDPTVFGDSPPLSSTLRNLTIAVTAAPAAAWKAGAAASMFWKVNPATALASATCNATLWVKTSDFSGAHAVGVLNDAVPCTSTAGISYTPPRSIPSGVYFVALTVSSAGAYAQLTARSEPFEIKGGSSPPGLCALQGNCRSGTGRRGLLQDSSDSSGSLCSSAFPVASAAYKAPLCARDCASCVAAGGVMLVGAGLKFGFELTGFAGTEGDAVALQVALGAFSASGGSFCWPAALNSGGSVARTLNIGSIALIQAALQARGLPGVTASAYFSIDRDTAGTSACSAAQNNVQMQMTTGSIPANTPASSICNALIAQTVAAGGKNVTAAMVECTVTDVGASYVYAPAEVPSPSATPSPSTTPVPPSPTSSTTPTATPNNDPPSSSSTATAKPRAGFPASGVVDARALQAVDGCGCTAPAPGAQNVALAPTQQSTVVLSVRCVNGCDGVAQSLKTSASKPVGARRLAGALGGITGSLAAVPAVVKGASSAPKVAPLGAVPVTLNGVPLMASSMDALGAAVGNNFAAKASAAKASAALPPLDAQLPSATPRPSTTSTATQTYFPVALPSPGPLPAGAPYVPNALGAPSPQVRPSSAPAILIGLTLPAGTGAPLTLATLPTDAAAALIGAMSRALGVSTSAVTISSITSVGARALLASAARAAAVTGYTVNFAIDAAAVAAAQLPGGSGAVLAAKVLAAVQTAVNSGAISAAIALPSLATALGVSVATLSNPSSLAVVAPPGASLSLSAASITERDFAIAGGVVGGLFFLATATVIYLVGKRGHDKSTAAVALNIRATAGPSLTPA